MSTAATTTAFRKILRYGPGGLIISAGILLALQAVLVSKYYSDMLPGATWNEQWRTAIAAIASAALKMLAFFLLFMTVKDFSDGRSRIGTWGFSVTVILNAYFLFECHSMSALWSGNNGAYWHLFPFLAVMTIMVLFVEWRLAISVNTAAREEKALAQAETTIATYRKQLDDLTGKVTRYEAEMNAIEQRKQAESDRIAALEAEAAERKQAEEYAALQKELSALRRIAAKTDNDPTGKNKISAGKVETAIRNFMRINRGMKPTREQIAAICNVDQRSLRNHFPNGSLDGIIDDLFREINTAQPEMTHAN